MPTITINGVACEFTPGQMILQVANAHGVEIPFYCYHDGLSIAANCRICLGEAWAPNPRNDNKLEPFMGGKLVPTCQTQAQDGMVVHTDSPKAVANQKAVMEYLLINHPLDCPVCDQAGECLLQDYSYQYGRGVSRFEETKVKNPKKNLGPNVYLYSDRCIMCTRCVRFTREVSGTAELYVDGRGNREEIDVFPGVALDNEIAANVIDLCPVGALLDKDFLFAQRVWFLKRTASIDGITASGDNLWVEHNEGKVYRIKPRTNLEINKHWITDEVRYGWKHVHSDDRLRSPRRRQYGALVEDDWNRCLDKAAEGLAEAAEAGKRIALLVSPMLPCEEAFALAEFALSLDPHAVLGVGPVPFEGQDKVFPPGASEDDARAFKLYAEKAPNARGVRRVLAALTGAEPLEFAKWTARAQADDAGAVIITANYREACPIPDLLRVADRESGRFVVVIDTLNGPLVESADVVLPGATWVEKGGTFENARGTLQAFDAAIPPIEFAKPEGQIASDLEAALRGVEVSATSASSVVVVDEGPGQVPQAAEIATPRGPTFSPADTRTRMGDTHAALAMFKTDVRYPEAAKPEEADMRMVEL